MKRLTDVLIAMIMLIFCIVPCLLISCAIKFTSRGPILYWSERVGKNNIIFLMPKFRSMKISTPKVATHLLCNASEYLIPVGSFLRKTSLDEIPQLWSILIGDMSLVGPRPALFNQYDLVVLRNQYGVDKLVPGLTGWAQINGRDSLSIQEKVQLDVYYLKNSCWRLDLKILLRTICYAIKRLNVSH